MLSDAMNYWNWQKIVKLSKFPDAAAAVLANHFDAKVMPPAPRWFTQMFKQRMHYPDSGALKTILVQSLLKNCQPTLRVLEMINTFQIKEKQNVRV